MRISNFTHSHPHLKAGASLSRGSLLLALAVALVVLAGSARPALASFGISSLKAEAVNADGTLDTQAGSHPYGSTVAFELATEEDPGEPGSYYPDENVKDVTVDLPAGFTGDPTAVPTCHRVNLAGATCPPDTQVGVITLDEDVFGTLFLETVGVYNVDREVGQTAAFGFQVDQVPVYIVASLRPGDHGIRTKLENLSEAIPVIGSSLTLWGVPAEASHDAQRGSFYRCLGDPTEAANCGGGGAGSGVPVKPFLTNPTVCGTDQQTYMTADSWQTPGTLVRAQTSSPALTGCGSLTFEPAIEVTPDSRQPSSPTGLTFGLSIPQNVNPGALATPPLRTAVVTLPAGMSISPSGAGGLQGCTDAQIGIGTEQPDGCPAASKIGEVTIHTPLLPEPLTGDVFLGTPQSNDPTSGREFRIFLDGAAADYGVSIRLEGNLSVDPTTGRVRATFDNNPQLPFSELLLTLKGGPRAPLSTPAECGTYTTEASLTPWSAGEGEAPATVSDAFTVSFDGAGGACAASRPFAPAFSAGTVNNQGGAFSPFTVTFSRSDADQTLGAVTVRTPPGLLGVLKSVVQCPEPQAAQGACGAGSLIGHTTVAAGPGSDPFYLGGQVFLTGPYQGAPFGLSIVVPALAGPFNLGTVVVRAVIAVDPTTTALTISSDPLPTILQGVPLQLRTVNVTVDRAGFMFNPTSCGPRSVTGAIDSAEGASEAVSSRFQASGCGSLAFKPKLSASLAGKSSRANGAALDVEVSSGAGQANIGRVAVSLPRALPSRLTTIQKACPQATFAASPASCPVGSLVGSGTAVTPILAHALAGPAYLVSHGGAAFPDLVVVLRGEGITVDLTGAIDITKAGITSSTFNNVPDVPIGSFELKLPTGSHSALTANLPGSAKGSFCGQSLTMPTSITGQNGGQVKQSTKLAVTGCAKTKKRTSKPTGSGKKSK